MKSEDPKMQDSMRETVRISDRELWCPKLQFMATFGLSVDSTNNIIYTSESTIAYPCSNAVVLNDYATKEQDFLLLGQSPNQIDRMTLSHDREFLAVAEKGTHLRVFVFSMKTSSMEKLLNIPFKDIKAKNFAALEFSCNGILLAIVGAPEYQLIQFNWQEGKITHRVDLALPSQTVTDLAVNPCDPCRLVVVGSTLYREMHFIDYVWRSVANPNLAKRILFIRACWLNEVQVAASTNDGRIVVFESGQIRDIYNVETLVQFSNPPLTREEEVKWIPKVVNRNQVPDNHRGEFFMVRNITSFKQGFAFSYNKGLIYIFKQTDKYSFVKTNVYDIPCINCNYINTMAFNPSGTFITITTDTNEFFGGKLFEPQNFDTTPTIFLTAYTYGSHKGPIAHLTIAKWKPILMTVGTEDNSIRIWNPQLRKLLMVEKFSQVFSAAIHPSGMLCAVGLHDHLELDSVTISGIQAIWKVSIERIPFCRFSNNGHQLGVIEATRQKIFIYTTLDAELIHVLEDPLGELVRFRWTASDSEIWTAGKLGSICRWVIRSESRDVEVTTESGHQDVCCTPCGQIAYVGGKDGLIREIRGGVVTKVLDIKHKVIRSIEMAHSGCMLFAAGDRTTIVAIQYPIEKSNQYKEFIFHKNPITAVRLIFHDKTLVSTSSEGTLCFWNVRYHKIPEIKRLYLEPLLVATEDIAHWDSTKKDLYSKIYDLNEHYSSQMYEKSEYYGKHMCVVAKRLDQDIKTCDKKIKKISRVYETSINKIKDDIQIRVKTEDTTMAETLENLVEKTKKEKDMIQKKNAELTLLNMDIEKMIKFYEGEIVKVKAEAADKINIAMERCNKLVNILDIKKVKDNKRGEQVRLLLERQGEKEIAELRMKLSKDQKVENCMVQVALKACKKKFWKMKSLQKKCDKADDFITGLQNRNDGADTEITRLREKYEILQMRIHEEDRKLEELQTIKNKSSHVYVSSMKVGRCALFLREHTKSETGPIEHALTIYSQDKAELQAEITRLNKKIVNTHSQLDKLQREVSQRNKNNISMKNNCKLISSMHTCLLEDLVRISSTLNDPKAFTEAFRKRLQKLADDEDDDYLKEMEDERRLSMKDAAKAKSLVKQRQKMVEVPEVQKPKERKRSTFSPELLQENRCLLQEVKHLRKYQELLSRTSRSVMMKIQFKNNASISEDQIEISAITADF